MDRDLHSLEIKDVVSEIGGAATSVTFQIPQNLMDIFQWKAGQHITLRITIDGEEQRRSYTISNPPDSPLRITVKRVNKGVVSNHIADAFKVGDKIDVMPPFGSFCLTPGPQDRRTHMFFGAGSGITPLFAMINTVLRHEPHSVAHLVYGNSDAKSILFQDALAALQNDYPDRFTLRHALSSPSIWSWFTPWRTGRLDAMAIKDALSETPPVAQNVRYWICGPGKMNTDVTAALMALDVPKNRIHTEHFGGAERLDTSVAGMAATAQVTLNGTRHTVPVSAEQTLLEASRAAGLTPPFSCQSGVCGACKAHVTHGNVHMRSRIALDDTQVAKGEILTCQSVAASSVITFQFDK